MSEPEGFLTRWNRRKREAKHDAAAAAEAAIRTGEGSAAAPRTSLAGADESAAAPRTSLDDASGSAVMPRTALANVAEGTFDVSSLPPIESITAASDIRAFLAPGVPSELARAALRRAWSVDPAVRDFVGIAENQWDFTAPNEILGFGPLESREEIARLVAKVFGDDRPDDGPEPDNRTVSAPADGKKKEAAAEESRLPRTAKTDVVAESIVQRGENTIAAQYSEQPDDNLDTAHPRGHGRALPQ